MYEVLLERQMRLCPVDATSLTRQFRRYFDRFEGRIREPPFAVYDDLAYTQGSTPERFQSVHAGRDTGSVGGMVTGPNLEEYRERLRGFAIDLGTEDDVMQRVFTAGEEQQAADFDDLYNIPMIPNQQQTLTANYANTIEDSGFSNLDAFTTIPESGYPTTTTARQVFNPLDLGSVPTLGSFPSATATVGGMQNSEDSLDFKLDESDFAWDDVFGDMPDMPGLDGIIDQGFLEFLDTPQ
jgi:hypothetical protein